MEVHLLGLSPRDGGCRGALEVLIQLVWKEPARVLSPLPLLACSLRWDQEGVPTCAVAPITLSAPALLTEHGSLHLLDYGLEGVLEIGESQNQRRQLRPSKGRNTSCGHTGSNIRAQLPYPGSEPEGDSGGCGANLHARAYACVCVCVCVCVKER